MHYETGKIFKNIAKISRIMLRKIEKIEICIRKNFQKIRHFRRILIFERCYLFSSTSASTEPSSFFFGSVFASADG